MMFGFKLSFGRVYSSQKRTVRCLGFRNAYCCVQFMVHRDRIRLRLGSWLRSSLENVKGKAKIVEHPRKSRRTSPESLRSPRLGRIFRLL